MPQSSERESKLGHYLGFGTGLISASLEVQGHENLIVVAAILL